MDQIYLEFFQAEDGTVLDRAIVEGKNLVYVPGLCAADPSAPNNPRNRDWYIENTIKSLLTEGKIDDGSKTPFDDRKIRLDAVRTRANTLEVGLGVTHYLAFLEDLNRDPPKNKELQQQGMTMFNDKYAFFSRALAVATAVISKEGSVFLGERMNKDVSTGVLNSVAGYVTYRGLEGFNLEDDIRREMREEYGIMPEDIREINLAGFCSDALMGQPDVAYITSTNLPDEYFASGTWKERATEQEHGDLFQLRTYRDIQKLLNEGIVPNQDRKYSLMFSTQGALQSIRPGEVRD